MDYKKMITAYAKNGGSEDKMWASVDVTEMAMEYIKETNPEKYDCLMRKLHESLYGKHYTEQLAMSDVAEMHSVGVDGMKHIGAHWTIEQVEEATSGKTFPKGTTRCDRFVAYNATWHDLHKKFTDAQILDAAYLLWFDDEDWRSEGKIWDYMSMR